MDAYSRRLGIFKAELKVDIKTLSNLILVNDFEAIKAFAHKYKMRLTYFKYNNALNLCTQIEFSYKESDFKGLISIAKALHEVLNKTLIELTDESISS